MDKNKGSIRYRVYIQVEGLGKSFKSRFFFNFIMFLIMLNFCAIIVESFLDPDSDKSYILNIYHALKWFEVFSVTIFISEYLLRIWTAGVKYNSTGIKPVLKFILSPMGLIDLLSIVPFFFTLRISAASRISDGRILRIFRLTRLFRLLKLNRYFNSLSLIINVFRNKKDELLTTIFIMFMLLITSSVFMYEIESSVQPDKFTNVFSSTWWAIATLTTVGYGDIYPITTLGRLLSGIIAIIGIGMVALPTGIISSGFLEELNNRKLREEHESQEQALLQVTTTLETISATNSFDVTASNRSALETAILENSAVKAAIINILLSDKDCRHALSNGFVSSGFVSGFAEDEYVATHITSEKDKSFGNHTHYTYCPHCGKSFKED